MTTRRALLAALAGVAALPPTIALAQAADPGAAQIEAFDSTLLETMKQAKSLGAQGRFAKLSPAVQRAFDLPTMTRFAVGPKWAGLSGQEQSALVKAFTRLTVANYAHNFDGYGGEKFSVSPEVQTRGPDKLVKSQILQPNAKPVDLIYRMRQASDGRWAIIDVYYNGSISELAARRSDFSSTVNAGGAPALLAKIDTQVDKLLKTS